MLYIQARKGKFPIAIAPDGRKVIEDTDAFLRWVVEHNSRQVSKANYAEGRETVDRIAIDVVENQSK
jgi:hypothetical protein